MPVLEYAVESGLFLLVEQRVRVAMKPMVYSVMHRAQTVIGSLVLHFAHGTSEIIKAIDDAGIGAYRPYRSGTGTRPTSAHSASPS
jgi:hypothetical protein